MEMVDTNRMPPSAHEFALMDMGFSTGEFCRLSRHQPGWSTSRYLFYPGCQLAGSTYWMPKPRKAAMTATLIATTSALTVADWVMPT